MSSLHQLHQQYIRAEPFPHIVIDNFLHENRVIQAYMQFPAPTDIPWYKYDNIFEKKLAFDKIDQIPSNLANIAWELNSGVFIQWLEVLTGIQDLTADDSCRGGGLHCILEGGKLDIHADFNIHPVTKLHRRINAILFLNKEWQEDWGGELELWNVDMTECVRKITPLFNRLVVFNVTDKSFHGQPNPLRSPENVTRKSMAWYYYTKDRPVEELTPSHSTVYKKRPQDAENPEIENLRLQRAQGRLADLKVEMKK